MFENENNENQVIEEVTENVEETTEETTGEVEQIAVEQPEEKVYTKSEYEAGIKKAVDKAVTRRDAKLHKEYQRKYGELEAVLKAGTKKEDVGEITEDFRKFYEGRGVPIPKTAQYSAEDIKVLAAAEANEIISGGLDDVTEELNRLTSLGFDGMSAREKQVYKQLAEYHQGASREIELAKLGVPKEVYNSPEFKDFASKFSKDISITEIYGIYNKTQPRKEIKSMGSMKSGQEPKVKDYYSPEEIEKLTEDELDDPKVWEAVRRSMTGGRK